MRPSALPETCSTAASATDPATVWVGPGGVAGYLGPPLRLAPHSGSVACFILGLDAPFWLRTSDQERLLRSALVPARTHHHLSAGSGRMLFLYVEPGSPRAGRLAERMTDRADAVWASHAAEQEIIDGIVRTHQRDISAVIASIAPDGPTSVTDERIRRALRLIRRNPQAITAATLAADLGLSRSRLLHLFSAEVGTSFRRYRLWARLLLVADALGHGSTLTRAAADAGFSSPSHLSDTVRGMFGLTLTKLLTDGTNLVSSV